MAYRSTPLENGFSPSELLMGRRINTTLPVAKTQLQPYSENKKVLEAKEERRIEGQKRNYDNLKGNPSGRSCPGISCRRDSTPLSTEAQAHLVLPP
ncbi:hypothetical protein AVEN_44982-1 [Araneus ventricosus]|uniref:Uncharacterized protein n=1 Tax=Araneus ventricosus TaxID=182803 RepID=A0A4Y2U067_ARAVE|nr:hypothetical protein AVEN_44982-1 [Araneus ventricosus]